MVSDLPIEELRGVIMEAGTSPGAAVILQAPTGSGKSTQVPQMLVDGGVEGEVVVLQPRRIAARMLGARVAWERGGVLGDEVGYQVRFERVVGPRTRLRFVTEGVLLRQMLDDPDLRRVGAVVFDEFHERHLDGDVGLARCRQLQATRRPDLRLVVMSATLETGTLESFLDPCRVLTSEGRTYPVEIRYRPQGGRGVPLWEKMARAAREVVKEDGIGGHFLLFLPGAFEIRKTVECLRREKWAKEMEIHPLYGDLSPREQDAAVAPSARPKIIVATNVAETSLTIDGVVVVIDSGLARRAQYDAQRGLNTLTVEPIAQSSADQRAGRAGRTRPGVCVRLWSEAHHRARPLQEKPEIHRLDLAETVLHLKRLGLGNPAEFPWYEAPEPETLERALRLLRDLGAVEGPDDGLTAVGRRMADFPVSPRYGRLLVEAEKQGGVEVWAMGCLVTALGQARPLWPRGQAGDRARQAFMEPGDGSDWMPLVRAYRAASAAGFRLERCRELGLHAGAAREVEKLFRLLVARGGKKEGTGEAPAASLADLVLPAFPDQIGARRGRGSKVFLVTGGRRGQLDWGTVMGSEVSLVVATEMTEVEGREVQVILGMATAIGEPDLERHFPGEMKDRLGARYDAGLRRVVAERQRCFRDLVLDNRQEGEPPEDLAAALLAEQVVAGNLRLKMWDHAVENWLARVKLMGRAMPELEVPEFTEEDRHLVVTEICRGAVTYKQIKDRAVLPELKEWLSAPLRGAMEAYVPERVELKNGLRLKVDYVSDPEPSISAVLQRLYDVNEVPGLCDGRVPLKIHILAPNQRPAQVTSDLRSFWENGYPAVKAQLKGRYPKHEWR